jgi:putative N6-adenine-specific DNA methylase
MTTSPDFEIFLVAAPGFESALCDEAKELKFNSPQLIPGGVTICGHWRDVWRANLELRGASRILARMGSFRALHLAQLDKRARKFPWGETLRTDVPVHVEATCKSSRIYHGGAAAQRIATAIREELGAPIADDAALIVKVRIDDDLCIISVDTSGESLHKRGHKLSTGKAPLRETLAALFLRQCGYTGHEPVVDPMCGSGTFIIEAAEMAAGLKPGRTRHFAFEHLVTFNAKIWNEMRTSSQGTTPSIRFTGSDRDAGAIRNATANAARAGVSDFTDFKHHAISDLHPPEGPSGLVIINPPYGTRIGNKKPLHDLHAALGKTLLTRFKGWRVGLITTDAALAKATGLPFAATNKPVSHGGLKVVLYQTAAM